MNIYRIKTVACLLAMAGCIQFIVLTIMAMFTFPGGIHPGIPTVGYNFFENFFSDLGGTSTPSSLPNPVSSVLFFIALLGIGVLSMPFICILPTLYSKQKISRLLGSLGSIVGVISAIAFIGVAFTPWNLFLLEHVFFVQVAFIGLIPLAALYLLAIISTKEKVLPRKYVAILVEFLIAAILYVVLLFSGPGLNTPAGLIINALGQKLIVYNAIIFIGALACGTRQVIRATNPVQTGAKA